MKTTFIESLERIHQKTGARTQIELADLFGIRQSSVSDAKRRGNIPDSWLIALLRKYSLNPDWILTGQGAQYLAPKVNHAEAVQ